MRLEDIDADVRNLAFEFFYWFSRFEFALKENGFWKNRTLGSPAEPGWEQFVAAHQTDYILSEVGSHLIAANPLRQVVGQHELEFVPVGTDDRPSELKLVVRLLKTVRNNLFHGGKHGAKGWDDPQRTLLFLEMSIRLLNELSELGGIEGDYKYIY